MMRPPEPIAVPVDVAGRPYHVLIGPQLIERVGEYVTRLHLLAGRCMLVTDRHVDALYGEQVHRSLARTGLNVERFVVEPSEGAKSFDELGRLLNALIDHDIERGDLIVALGGGVVGDLAGFAASVLRRGCHCLQIPTTLLAQVDSSVGGKTAINMAQGKNLVGTFFQPLLVLADTDVLASLDLRQRRAGYAEIVKYGLIDDAPFFDWLEANGPAVLSSEPEALTHAIVTSVKAKARIVEQDEEEMFDLRELLNLGHTFGHALEAATGMGDRLLHGEAVAMGCVLAFDISVKHGLCPADDARRVRAHFQAMGLETDYRSVTDASPSELIVHMLRDKKMRLGTLRFILVRGIGKAFGSTLIDQVAAQEFLEETQK